MVPQPKWEKIFSTKNLIIFAGVLLLLAITPLLILGKYNIMCYDDYLFGVVVHSTWVNTGSLKEAVIAAVNHANTNYMNWQGCWIVTFLTAMYPANFVYNTAWIVPVISIGLFATGTYLLGKQFLTKWFGGENGEANLVMFVLLFLFYQVMDSPFEGLYWYNGVIAYIVPQAFLFFFAAVIIKNLFSSKEKATITGCVLASVCAIVAVGGNYVTALQAEIVLFLLLAYTWFYKRKKWSAAMFPFLVGTICFCISIFSPGNASRSLADGVTGLGPVEAIILSFYYAGCYMIEWTPTIVVLVWIALAPVLWKIAGKTKRKFAHPVLVTAGVFCVYSAMFTPTLYAMGMVGLPRANNIIQMVYYLCLIGCTAYWLGWIHNKQETTALQAFLERKGNNITIIILLVVLFVWVGTMDKNTYTSISAVRSIVNGEGRTFYEESMERYELYNDESLKEVVVQPFSEKPALFDFIDISEDKGNWINQAVASYWHKNYVVVEEALSQ